MSRLLACSIALVVCVLALQVTCDTCKFPYYNMNTQKQYDLTPISGGAGYEAAYENSVFSIDICGTSPYPCVPANTASVCQNTTDAYVEWGLAANAVVSAYLPDKTVDGVSITYTTANAAYSVVHISCNKTIDPPTITQVETIDANGIGFYMQSKYACGQTPVIVCKYNNSLTNLTYDLSQLTLPSDATIFYNITSEEVQYLINVCAPATGAGCDPVNGVCAKNAAGTTGLGDAYTSVLEPYGPNITADGITILYSLGSACGPNVNIFSALNILCDPSVKTAVVDSVQIAADCSYDFMMRSSKACGLSSGSKSKSTHSFWWWIGVVGVPLIVVFVVIVGGAIAGMWFFKRYRAPYEAI